MNFITLRKSRVAHPLYSVLSFRSFHFNRFVAFVQLNWDQQGKINFRFLSIVLRMQLPLFHIILCHLFLMKTVHFCVVLALNVIVCIYTYFCVAKSKSTSTKPFCWLGCGLCACILHPWYFYLFQYKFLIASSVYLFHREERRKNNLEDDSSVRVFFFPRPFHCFRAFG